MATAKFTRLLSLDVFRGLTIAVMILVNSPGNQTAYSWLNHSAWNGCTLADLVFPFFVFIMGVSVAFSLSKSIKQNVPKSILLRKIIQRTVLIFLIGLFLNAFPTHFHFATIRVYGVLQRIAICYLAAALIFLTTTARTQFIIMLALLIGYWLTLTLIPVPGFGTGNLTAAGNLGAYIDRLVFSSAHLYEKIFDPEGILSTFPAIATALLGTLTGSWLLSTSSGPQKKFHGLAISGVIAATIGWLWGFWFPINKGLWTSSYVLWTGGLALLLLSCCYWLLEIKQWQKWSRPLEIFGVNAIAAYFFHIFFLKIQAIIHIHRADGTVSNLRIFITEHLFGWASLKNASLMYAFLYVLFWFLVLAIFYRKKIFIKM